MQCHYCGADAAVVVEKDHVGVGLCERHLRDRMAALSHAAPLEALEADRNPECGDAPDT